MIREVIDNTLNKHTLWLKTGGKQGEQADFRGADLAWYDFGGDTLQQACLSGANLEKSCLYNVNLEGADLSKAKLKGARLYNTWKGIPLVLGNVLVTKCEGFPNYIEEWIEITDKNRDLLEGLYL